MAMEAVEGINQTIMTNTQCRLRRWRSAPKERAPPRAGGTLARRDSHRHPGVCIAPIRQPRLNGYTEAASASPRRAASVAANRGKSALSDTSPQVANEP